MISNINISPRLTLQSRCAVQSAVKVNQDDSIDALNSIGADESCFNEYDFDLYELITGSYETEIFWEG